MSTSGVRSLNTFAPPSGCAAEEVLANRSKVIRADFGTAVRYLFGTASSSEADHVLDEEILESIENNFELEKGMGKLAWQCAMCQTHGNLCQQEEESS